MRCLAPQRESPGTLQDSRKGARHRTRAGCCAAARVLQPPAQSAAPTTEDLRPEHLTPSTVRRTVIRGSHAQYRRPRTVMLSTAQHTAVTPSRASLTAVRASHSQHRPPHRRTSISCQHRPPHRRLRISRPAQPAAPPYEHLTPSTARHTDDRASHAQQSSPQHRPRTSRPAPPAAPPYEHLMPAPPTTPPTEDLTPSTTRRTAARASHASTAHHTALRAPSRSAPPTTLPSEHRNAQHLPPHRRLSTVTPSTSHHTAV